MAVDWTEVQKVLSPIRDYEELCRQWQGSFSYAFVREAYNFSMPALAEYTQQILGGDTRQRYAEYAAVLIEIIGQLGRLGVQNIEDLFERVDAREKLEQFVAQSGIAAPETATVLKYLFYWVIPKEKYLNQLVRDDPDASRAASVLGEMGIRFNLALLQQGIDAAGREALAAKSGLSQTVILDLVNRADLSRIPWASKATLSNIIGAGYGSLARLADANLERLAEDFFAYGRAIGKDLRLGNEIESSQRIAKIVPAIVR
jgi:hypothetical protein